MDKNKQQSKQNHYREKRKDLNIPKFSDVCRFISFVFHPVFMPLYGTLFYFLFTPRFYLPQNIRFLVYYLLIVSIIIPLLFLFVLLYTKTISGLEMKYPKERLFFSVIMGTVYYIIFSKIDNYHQYIELYPFFFGIFLSTVLLGIYNLLKQKPSIHTTAIGGLLTFFIIWSYYSRINILVPISAIILTGSVITASRYYLHAHSTGEIIRGFIIGILSQVIAFYFVLRFY